MEHGDQAAEIGQPEPPIDARQTHISVLFFAGDRVYKLPKPIRTAYLDQSTPERRAAAVRAELELNRRFAPDVYLGTGELREDGRLSDAVLVMRRLPRDRALSGLLGRPDAERLLEQVVHRIATVHAATPPVYEPYPMTTSSGLLALWESSLTDIARHVGTVVDADEYVEVARLARDYLVGAEWLFDDRRRRGNVRDGHGDLTADDIFVLDDGPRILDGLAFDVGLRISDVLADIGFLVMDVERLAGPELADGLLRRYGELTDEHHPASLANHYVAYRAHVRAKVALLRYEQGDVESAGLARRYHAQALGRLRRARRRLIVIGGAPGTGKSTVADALSSAFGWTVVDSDTLRKDMARIDHDDHEVARHPDLYDPATTERVYREMCRRAGALLRAGESVVVDATWSTTAQRELAHEVARTNGAELVDVECRLPPAIAAERIRARQSCGRDPSDATPALASRLASTRDPWPSAIAIDTTPPSAVVAAVAIERLGR